MQAPSKLPTSTITGWPRRGPDRRWGGGWEGAPSILACPSRDCARERRPDSGLSQEELAERAGLHWTFISVVERGLKAPGLNRIGQLATALEISLPELFNGVTPGQRQSVAETGRPRGSRKQPRS